MAVLWWTIHFPAQIPTSQTPWTVKMIFSRSAAVCRSLTGNASRGQVEEFSFGRALWVPPPPFCLAPSVRWGLMHAVKMKRWNLLIYSCVYNLLAFLPWWKISKAKFFWEGWWFRGTCACVPHRFACNASQFLLHLDVFLVDCASVPVLLPYVYCPYVYMFTIPMFTVPMFTVPMFTVCFWLDWFANVMLFSIRYDKWIALNANLNGSANVLPISFYIRRLSLLFLDFAPAYGWILVRCGVNCL